MRFSSDKSIEIFQMGLQVESVHWHHKMAFHHTAIIPL